MFFAFLFRKRTAAGAGVVGEPATFATAPEELPTKPSSEPPVEPPVVDGGLIAAIARIELEMSSLDKQRQTLKMAVEILRHAGIVYDNVRDWQDFNPVNADIKQTIQNKDERPRFALMNNGITVIAKKMRGTGNRFFIEDYQVVNGCQTSHVLYYCRQHLDESIMVPLRLIATNNEHVISAIIKATNRQTEVKEEHLLALSDFSKKLEAFFPTFRPQHLYYERRSKQYNGDPNVEKTRVITPAYLIRAFASVFLEEPHRATRSYRTLLEGVGKSIFASDHRLEPYYLAAFILYRLEFLFRNQLLDPKYKPARYHILLAARILAAPDDLPRMNSHEMQRYCEKILNILSDTTNSDACFRAAANVVDTVAKGNFHRDHIRTQPFTESLIGSSRKVEWMPT